MQHIPKIVITGGPCGGKSTALSKIEKHFSMIGYRVVFVNETATEMILNGAAPWVGTNANFQQALLGLQTFKENIYSSWARGLGEEKVLLVCDRGALDNKAYMTREDFVAAVKSVHTNEIELRDNYDAVFHLVTAANGAAEFYTTENNQARTETVEQAIELDNKLIAAWTGHPHFRVIDNSTDFEVKINRLLSEIASFLGEPEPMEIERKYLIDMPDLSMLESLPNCTTVEIIQTYLCSGSPEIEVRVRQRGKDGHFIFVETTKRRLSNIKRVETERRLSKDEYLALLMNVDTTLKQIRKTRYCLSHGNFYLEIDVFPFWQKTALLEVELADERQEIFLPNFIKVAREVTDDLNYTNHSIASVVPQGLGE